MSLVPRITMFRVSPSVGAAITADVKRESNVTSTNKIIDARRNLSFIFDTLREVVFEFAVQKPYL
jgi:hypothetical protein